MRAPYALLWAPFPFSVNSNQFHSKNFNRLKITQIGILHTQFPSTAEITVIHSYLKKLGCWWRYAKLLVDKPFLKQFFFYKFWVKVKQQLFHTSEMVYLKDMIYLNISWSITKHICIKTRFINNDYSWRHAKLKELQEIATTQWLSVCDCSSMEFIFLL